MMCFCLYGRSGRFGMHAWHGGCLALAEFARRGFISNEKLPDVLNIIVKAIAFDVRSGDSSLGEIVRDAACYVLWGISRSYSSEHLMKLDEFSSGKISQLLLNTALFDREVNVRRAASATFQECLGRLGEMIFPCGIYINTKVDFFTVGNRNDSYSKLIFEMMDDEEKNNVSNELSFVRAYGLSFVNHLSKIKLFNWDPAIRRLAADTLAKLLDFPQFRVSLDEVLNFLIFKSRSNYDIEIDGSFFALSKILRLDFEKKSFVKNVRTLFFKQFLKISV
jgi:tubulin-specific chaperone D